MPGLYYILELKDTDTVPYMRTGQFSNSFEMKVTKLLKAGLFTPTYIWSVVF